MKICNQKDGALTAAERAELAKLLVLAGYTVRIGCKKRGKSAAYTYYVEIHGDDGRNGGQP